MENLWKFHHLLQAQRCWILLPITTGDIINIATSTLTTGHAFDIVDNSTDTSSRQTVRVLVNQNAAVNAIAAHFEHANGGGVAVSIDGLVVSSHTATTQICHDLSADNLTTGTGLQVVRFGS